MTGSTWRCATAARGPILSALAVALALAGCAASPVGPPPLTPTSTDTAKAAVRQFLDRTYADQSTLRYSFAPLIASRVHIAGITERGYFVCGTVVPIEKAEIYVGQEVFFAHFNPLLRDVVDNASVQPSGPSETRALCGQAYAYANTPLGDVMAEPPMPPKR